MFRGSGVLILRVRFGVRVHVQGFEGFTVSQLDCGGTGASFWRARGDEMMLNNSI